GRRAGVTTILVEPLSPEEEHWYTRMKRPFERLVLRSWRKHGTLPPMIPCVDSGDGELTPDFPGTLSGSERTRNF
ncbi:MAG: hypothetical protein Q4C47_06805, partial [Planctomycetia bacterium]|nr:hypothetical protein [Planctomycetia bacterium]